MANIFGRQADTQIRDLQRGKVRVHLEPWQEKSSKMLVHTFKSSPKYGYLRVLDSHICTQVEMPGKKEISHEHFKAVTTPQVTENEQHVYSFVTEVQKKSNRKTVKYLRQQQMLSCKEALSIHLKVFGVKCQLSNKDYNLRDYAEPSSGWEYMASGKFSS